MKRATLYTAALATALTAFVASDGRADPSNYYSAAKERYDNQQAESLPTACSVSFTPGSTYTVREIATAGQLSRVSLVPVVVTSNALSDHTKHACTSGCVNMAGSIVEGGKTFNASVACARSIPVGGDDETPVGGDGEDAPAPTGD